MSKCLTTAAAADLNLRQLSVSLHPWCALLVQSLSRFSSRTGSLVARLAVFGSVLTIGCLDSTAPIGSLAPGRYALTTVLDSFSYPTACHPTTFGTVCTQATMGAGSSMLSGTFTVGRGTAGPSNRYQFPVSDIVLHEADCAQATAQCTETTHQWGSGILEIDRDSLTLHGVLGGRVQIALRGRFAYRRTGGQSLYERFVGQLTWSTYLFCCGSSHYVGTFVAARQP